MTTKKTGTKKVPVIEAEITEWRKQRTAGETLETIAEASGRNLSVIYRHVAIDRRYRDLEPATALDP